MEAMLWVLLHLGDWRYYYWVEHTPEVFVPLPQWIFINIYSSYFCVVWHFLASHIPVVSVIHCPNETWQGLRTKDGCHCYGELSPIDIDPSPVTFPRITTWLNMTLQASTPANKLVNITIAGRHTAEVDPHVVDIKYPALSWEASYKHHTWTP